MFHHSVPYLELKSTRVINDDYREHPDTLWILDDEEGLKSIYIPPELREAIANRLTCFPATMDDMNLNCGKFFLELFLSLEEQIRIGIARGLLNGLVLNPVNDVNKLVRIELNANQLINQDYSEHPDTVWIFDDEDGIKPIYVPPKQRTDTAQKFSKSLVRLEDITLKNPIPSTGGLLESIVEEVTEYLALTGVLKSIGMVKALIGPSVVFLNSRENLSSSLQQALMSVPFYVLGEKVGKYIHGHNTAFYTALKGQLIHQAIHGLSHLLDKNAHDYELLAPTHLDLATIPGDPIISLGSYPHQPLFFSSYGSGQTVAEWAQSLSFMSFQSMFMPPSDRNVVSNTRNSDLFSLRDLSDDRLSTFTPSETSHSPKELQELDSLSHSEKSKQRKGSAYVAIPKNPPTDTSTFPPLPKIGPFQPEININWSAVGGSLIVIRFTIPMPPQLYLPVLTVAAAVVATLEVLETISKKETKKANGDLDKLKDHYIEIVTGGEDAKKHYWEGLVPARTKTFKEISTIKDPELRKKKFLEFADQMDADVKHIKTKEQEDDKRVKNCQGSKEQKKSLKETTKEFHEIYDTKIIPKFGALKRTAQVYFKNKSELLLLRNNPEYADEQEDINLLITQYEINEALAACNYDRALALEETLPESEPKTKILTETRKFKVDVSSEAELRQLKENKKYTEQKERIVERLDSFTGQRIIAALDAEDFSLAHQECAKILDESKQGIIEKSISENKVNTIFLIAHQQLKMAKTAEEFSELEKNYLTILNIDPKHAGAIQELSVCYLQQQKYDELQSCVEGKILASNPQDHFALALKGAAQLGRGETEVGRETLQAVLADGDSENEFVHELFIRSYDEEMVSVSQLFGERGEERLNKMEVALRSYARCTKDLLAAEIERIEAYLEAMKPILAEQEKHIEVVKGLLDKRQKEISEQEETEETQKKLQKIQKDQEALDKFIERQESSKNTCDIVREKCPAHRLQMNLAAPSISRFWYQSIEMFLDAGVYVANRVMERCCISKLPKDIVTHLSSIGDNFLQGMSHFYTRNIESILRGDEQEALSGYCLGAARYFLLGMRIVRDIFNLPAVWNERHTPSVVKMSDEYILPIVQLATSLGYIAMHSEDLLAGVFSFSPELLLQIPEIKRFLLDLDPKETFSKKRFMLGKTLLALREDTLINRLVHGIGYLSCFNDPITVWLKWGRNKAMEYSLVSISANCIRHLYDPIAVWFEGQKKSLMSKSLIKKTVEKVLPLLNCPLYVYCRFLQLAIAIYQTRQVSDKIWDEHCNVFYSKLFNLASILLNKGQNITAELIFRQLRELLADKNITGNFATRHSWYAKSRLYEQLAAKKFEILPIKPDGNCLFSSIEVFVDGYSADQLRQLTMDYIESHRAEMKEFITGDFDEYITRFRRDGEWDSENFGEPQIYALEKVLKRPIVILMTTETSEKKMTTGISKRELYPEGEPIYIYYNGWHYDAIRLFDMKPALQQYIFLKRDIRETQRKNDELKQQRDRLLLLEKSSRKYALLQKAEEVYRRKIAVPDLPRDASLSERMRHTVERRKKIQSENERLRIGIGKAYKLLSDNPNAFFSRLTVSQVKKPKLKYGSISPNC